MDKRFLLSSLISELLLLLLLLLAITPPSSAGSPFNSLLIPFISTSHTLSLLSTRRKRSRSPESDAPSKLPRRVQQPDSPIPRNPDSFKLCFKMTSSTFEWLSSLLEPLLECRDPVNSPLNLPVETRLGIGLFRLATGSDYLQISRRFQVSEHVAKFCVNQFCRVLCTNFRFWVGFPTPTELRHVTDSFETLTGFPNCCGVIHCTRFKILKNEAMEESVAAQFVVDSSSKILSIVAGINGKKGNHLVLKSSTLYKDIQSNNLLNSSTPIDINGVSIPQYLIGDRGYPFLPWLMVPFDQPVVNSHEDNFNCAHDLMLVSGFRTVDSLKKWGVLSKPIREETKTVVGYIGACSILHNALLMREDYSSLSDESCLRDTDSRPDYGDFSFEDDSFEEKSFEIRSALATRARRC